MLGLGVVIDPQRKFARKHDGVSEARDMSQEYKTNTPGTSLPDASLFHCGTAVVGCWRESEEIRVALGGSVIYSVCRVLVSMRAPACALPG